MFMLVFTRRFDTVVQLFKNSYRAKDSEIVNNRSGQRALEQLSVNEDITHSSTVLCCTVRLYLQRSTGI